MSIRASIASALEELTTAANAGEEITAPDGRKIMALVSGQTLDSTFLPGQELLANRINVRIPRAAHQATPELQSLWVVRGKTMRLAEITVDSPACLALSLEDPES